MTHGREGPYSRRASTLTRAATDGTDGTDRYITRCIAVLASLLRRPPSARRTTGRSIEAGQNQLHFDLTSTSLLDQQQTVARALGLGGRHIDIGQRSDEGHVVLADPEGHAFCVIEPGNSFLADCGFIGALAGDGSQQAGYFWSEALGWPLVWDQDQETAIRSPDGGPKITCGGPPLPPKTGKCRQHFDLAPPVHGDQQAEVDRLISLGATRVDIGQGEVSWVVMADPDGHEFCVLTPR